MLPRLLGAVQFLTILPIRGRTVEPGRAAVFFPLVGATLGWTGGLLLAALNGAISPTLAALIVLTAWIVLTGALHEDGLADVADAFRAGRTRERILEILKDSRIGSYGAVAIGLSLLARWQALASVPAVRPETLAASLALSRASMVTLAWIARPAGSGLGATFAHSLSSPAAMAVIAQAVAAAWFCGPRLGPLLLFGAGLIVLLARLYFEARLGGVTGDCLGAVCQLVEIYCLVVIGCRSCI